MVDSQAFSGARSLRTLLLKRMTIGDIAETAFAGLTSLNELDLSQNRMSTLRTGVFLTCTNLGSLYVSCIRTLISRTLTWQHVQDTCEQSIYSVSARDWDHHVVA